MVTNLPPVFVGREGILYDLEAASRRSWKGAGSLVYGNPGETCVVQGAPGAGKSSIIVELTNRLQEKTGILRKPLLFPGL